MSSCFICTTQGIALLSYGASNVKFNAKLVASIACLITKEEYTEFNSNGVDFSVVSVERMGSVYYCVICSPEQESDLVEMRLRCCFLTNTVNILYGEVFYKLVQYYDTKTSMELQKSTFSDLIEDSSQDEDLLFNLFEDDGATRDSLRLLEDSFLRVLSSIPCSQSVFRNWIEPLVHEARHLSNAMNGLFVLFQKQKDQWNIIYSVNLCENNTKKRETLAREWILIAAKHYESELIDNCVYLCSTVALPKQCLLITRISAEFGCAMLLPCDVLSNVTESNGSSISRIPMEDCFPSKFVKVWEYSCQCVRQAFPARTDLQNVIVSEAILQKLFCEKLEFVTIDDKSHEDSPLSPSELSLYSMAPSPIDMLGVRPTPPTSAKLSRSVVNPPSEYLSRNNSSNSTNGGRPGRTLRASTPDTTT